MNSSPVRGNRVDNWRTKWMLRRKDIALSLAKGVCGASYAEAVIILSAAISAVAAELHPGKGKDKVRFVELLTDASPSDCGLISVPLLISHLRRKQSVAEADVLEARFSPYPLSQVVSTRDVDVPEKDILPFIPNYPLKDIRACSYAVLLYQEIRSSYAHQYDPGERADAWPMTLLRNEPASYVNVIGEPRRVHFHIEWIAKIAIRAAEYADVKLPPFPDPAEWWADGSTSDC